MDSFLGGLDVLGAFSVKMYVKTNELGPVRGGACAGNFFM